MVPIALFMGLAGGFTKLRWWSIIPAAVAWAIILAVTGDPEVTPIARIAGGLLVGGLNGAVGVAAAQGGRAAWRDFLAFVGRRSDTPRS